MEGIEMDLRGYILVLLCLILQLTRDVMADEESCKFVTNLIRKDLLMTAKPTKTDNGYVLAAGYLNYYAEREGLQRSNESRYMPLKFKEYDLKTNLDYSENLHMFILKADCATISMPLKIVGSKAIVVGVNVDLSVPNNGISSCKLVDVNIVQEYGRRIFNCDRERDCGSKVCKSENGSDVVDLVFACLQFDISNWPYRSFTLSEL